MPERRSDTSSSRRGEGETEGRGDEKTDRQRDKETMRWERIFPLSLRRPAVPSHPRPVSLSLRLSVTLSLCLFVSVAGSIQTESFEKQALALAKELPASDLDAELPSRSLGNWLEQVFG